MTKSNGRKKIRFAVVGAGNIAQVAVMPGFSHVENAELVTIVSSDPEKREELGKRYGLERTYSYAEYDELCRGGTIDAVYIALPNAMHREYTERAAGAKIHVLCEKPMAHNAADCEAMIRVCDEHRVKLMIAYRLHFEQANLKAIELVKSGAIGKPRIFSSEFTQQARPGDIRTQADMAGGALYDTGVYCINAARYIFRDEPIEVTAFLTRGTDPRFTQVEEMGAVLLRFPEGRLAQFVTSQGASSVSTYRVIGTSGDLRMEPAFDYTKELMHHLTIEGRTREARFSRRDQFAPEVEYFARCILEDLEPEPSGREGLADIRVLEAIFESARTGEDGSAGVRSIRGAGRISRSR